MLFMTSNTYQVSLVGGASKLLLKEVSFPACTFFLL